MHSNSACADPKLVGGYVCTYTTQVSIEEAQETIDYEMKASGMEYIVYETSCARTGQT